MADIEALRLLIKDIHSIQSLPNPPQSYDGIEQFEKTSTEVIDHACDTTQKVAKYGEAIDAKMKEMSSALNELKRKNAEQLKKTINSLAGNHKAYTLTKMQWCYNIIAIFVPCLHNKFNYRR
ncbi:hypothetical protein ACJMK2_003042 [Sinanodonta woodiana]|uniref:Uncharacterized protein n=1 Tax=Sinanodonta woodiana TaxID=1069815 RepID=A0ABD3XX00_SINWO